MKPALPPAGAAPARALATPGAAAPAGQPSRADLAKAAARFEAIFVRQVLASARKADLGGKDLMGSQGLDTFRQMMDERFADIAAERGAFGIGRMLESQMAGHFGPKKAG